MIAIFVVIACSRKQVISNNNEPDSIISSFEFGSKYGFCIGNQCITTYTLTTNGLVRTTSNAIGGDKKILTITDSGKINIASTLLTTLPVSIKQLKKDTVYGCPDCYDQGGIMVKLVKQEKPSDTLKVLFDNSIESNPKEFQAYLKQMKEALADLNQ